MKMKIIIILKIIIIITTAITTTPTIIVTLTRPTASISSISPQEFDFYPGKKKQQRILEILTKKH